MPSTCTPFNSLRVLLQPPAPALPAAARISFQFSSSLIATFSGIRGSGRRASFQFSSSLIATRKAGGAVKGGGEKTFNSLRVLLQPLRIGTSRKRRSLSILFESYCNPNHEPRSIMLCSIMTFNSLRVLLQQGGFSVRSPNSELYVLIYLSFSGNPQERMHRYPQIGVIIRLQISQNDG